MEVEGRENNQHEESSEWFVKYLNRQGDWLEKTRGNLMVAATVIAAMSFQVMVSPPGGVWQSDDCCLENQTGTVPVCKGKAGIAALVPKIDETERVCGTAVLQHGSKHVLYLAMVISCTVSFSASMSLILLVSSGLRLRNRMIMAILVTSMVAAVLCISVAFYCAIALVQYDNPIIGYILLFYVGFWIVFPVLILVIQLVRLLYWLICFLCCRRPRQRRSPPRLPPLAPSLVG